MLVIADSSPLIVLLDIDHVGILPGLFGQVAIPPEVAAELGRSSRSQIVREFVAGRPSWLSVRSPTVIEAIPALHAGERAALSLARELRADLLLIDEARGRRAAAERRIPFTGTIGVIEVAAERGLLDLKEAFERVKRTDFWISQDLLDERLKLYLSRKSS